MNNRSWLWLLLVPLSLAPQTVTAQPSPARASPTTQPAKRSHLDLPGGPNMETAQEEMADRLKELHELHQLQDQMQDLLRDPEFVDRLKKIPSEERQRLREKIFNGKGLSQDKNWENLLNQASSANKLNKQQIDLLRRFAERADKNGSMPAPPGDTPGVVPSPSSPSPQSQPMPFGPRGAISPPPPKEASLWERLQTKSTDWIKDHVDDLGGDLADALYDFAGTDEGAPLADLFRTLKTPDFTGGGLAEPATDLVDHLSDVGEFLHKQRGIWDEVGSIFRHARDTSMSGVGGSHLSSLPPSPSVSSDDWGTGAMMLLSLGVLLLLFWKLGGWSRLPGRSGEAGQWKLGPWPVPPGAVSTRQDLVRAFEHLALLCLGRAASTCHHRELAHRLAVQDDLDNARRRQAADLLAWLYEQARYAPAEESLSPEELTEARHALCFLAGVPAA